MEKREFVAYNVLNILSVLFLGIAWGLILSVIIDLSQNIWCIWVIFSLGIIIAIINSFVYGSKYQKSLK
jgi:hypothetical protein